MVKMLKKFLAKRGFSSVDFVTLKTAMMLATLDGEVSAEELASFRDMASGCRGCTPKSFSKLWDEALRSAGYLLIQAKILPSDKLVALFVHEVKDSFVDEVSAEVSAERQHAFDVLAEMAGADGDFSEIERQAIDALKASVKECREEMITMLYPRAVVGGLASSSGPSMASGSEGSDRRGA